MLAKNSFKIYCRVFTFGQKNHWQALMKALLMALIIIVECLWFSIDILINNIARKKAVRQSGDHEVRLILKFKISTYFMCKAENLGLVLLLRKRLNAIIVIRIRTFNNFSSTIFKYPDKTKHLTPTWTNHFHGTLIIHTNSIYNWANQHTFSERKLPSSCDILWCIIQTTEG